jgi:hypothetical protein
MLSGCTYQIGAKNQMLWAASIVGVTFDNFEMMGMCQAAYNPFTYDTFIVDAGATYSLFSNLYIHGWTHKQFSCSLVNGQATGMCYGANIFTGTQGSGFQLGMQYQYLVVDGSDSDPTSWATFYDGMYDVSYSVFRYSSQMIGQLCHLFHDNLVEYWFDPGDGQAHGNILECVSEPGGANALYNNVFRHLSPDGIGQVLFWPIPCYTAGIPAGTCNGPSTDYVFNNVFYDVGAAGAGNYFDIGQNGSNQGILNIFNNTFEQTASNTVLSVLSCPSSFLHPFTEANNYYISEYNPYYTTPCNGRTSLTSLIQTHSLASAQGFTSSETFPFSPAVANTSTAGTGTNLGTLNNAFCSALSSAGLTGAATACQSDTTFACTYNISNHTVVCPARTPIPRPPSAGWDIGAYQYGTTRSVPLPPTQVTVVVQ